MAMATSPARTMRLGAPAGAVAEERRLLDAARAGDKTAYGVLLERHLAVAYRAAYLITGSATEAEDAAQEASVKAWLALARFRRGAPFRPWLVQIAINEARNRRRSAGRRAGLALRATGEARPTHASSAESEALGAQERAGLLAAMGALDEGDQIVIAARFFLGLSEAETAVALGIRRGTAKSRLSRALARLRAILEERQ
jgi:RNA polymerase sigma-70 factor, ECF subfamily